MTSVFFFASLALFNLPLWLGDTWHAGLLAIFALTALGSLRFGQHFIFPTRSDVDRHIEEQSQLKHRPLETLRDRPAAVTTEEAAVLWRKHLAQAAQTRSRLKIYLPRPDAARRDRVALRHAALLLLIISLFIARDDAGTRLTQALQPNIKIAGLQPPRIEAWIVPPAYTGAPAIILKKETAGITAPEGSLLKLRVSGTRFAPRISGEKMAAASARNYTLDKTLTKSGPVKITQFFRPIAAWNIEIKPDAAPEIAVQLAAPTPSGALKITYKAKDDYGIGKITGTISAKGKAETISFDIPSMAEGGEALTHIEDLTSHPLAGDVVTLTLTAADEMGRETTSAPETIILPQKKFTNPVAVRLITERQRLMSFDDWLTQKIVYNEILQVANRPGLYKGDPITFLALAMSAKRIAYDGDAESITSVVNMLWSVALKIEDGGLAQNTRDLSQALQKLQQMLADKKSSKADIDQMVAEVQKKMREYFQALAMEMQQRLEQGRNTGAISPEIAQKFMQHIDLGALIEQMRALGQGDSREQIRKMAEMLQNSIDNTDVSRLDQISKAQQQAMQSLEDLQSLIRDQQSLLDKTNKKMPDEDNRVEALDQSVLRQRLGDIIRRIGEVMPAIPENFGKADQAMKESQGTLEKNTPKESIPHQKTTLEELQKGMDDTIKQMAQGMQQMFSFGFMPQGNNFGEGYDPLGRGQASDSDVKIPDEKERRRVQEIIRELRNRSNDQQRPKVERDYLDRLLDSFN